MTVIQKAKNELIGDFKQLSCNKIIIGYWVRSTISVSLAPMIEQSVALTGRNLTVPPCSVGRPTAHALGPASADLSCARRLAGPPAALQTTTDDSEQNITGPLGGPVINRPICRWNTIPKYISESTGQRLLLSLSWHTRSSAPSLPGRVTWQMIEARPPPLAASALCFPQRFDTDGCQGWQEGHLARRKPESVTPKDSLPWQAERERKPMGPADARA